MSGNAEVSFKLTITPEIVKTYFEGVAKVESTKHANANLISECVGSITKSLISGVSSAVINYGPAIAEYVRNSTPDANHSWKSSTGSSKAIIIPVGHDFMKCSQKTSVTKAPEITKMVDEIVADSPVWNKGLNVETAKELVESLCSADSIDQTTLSLFRDTCTKSSLLQCQLLSYAFTLRDRQPKSSDDIADHNDVSSSLKVVLNDEQKESVVNFCDQLCDARPEFKELANIVKGGELKFREGSIFSKILDRVCDKDGPSDISEQNHQVSDSDREDKSEGITNDQSSLLRGIFGKLGIDTSNDNFWSTAVNNVAANIAAVSGEVAPKGELQDETSKMKIDGCSSGAENSSVVDEDPDGKTTKPEGVVSFICDELGIDSNEDLWDTMKNFRENLSDAESEPVTLDNFFHKVAPKMKIGGIVSGIIDNNSTKSCSTNSNLSDMLLSLAKAADNYSQEQGEEPVFKGGFLGKLFGAIKDNTSEIKDETPEDSEDSGDTSEDNNITHDTRDYTEVQKLREERARRIRELMGSDDEVDEILIEEVPIHDSDDE